MTPELARERLERMVAASSGPILSGDEIDELLELAKRPDTDGVPPSDEGWTPTWNLDYAAAEGWRRKAGKASEQYSATTDGATFHRQQMFSHCLRMADVYGRRVTGSTPVTVDDPAGTAVDALA